MLVLSEIYIYPIKGLPGIKLEQAFVEPMGLQYDRRMMLVDEKGRFISQREFPMLSQFHLSIENEVLVIVSPNKTDTLHLPLSWIGNSVQVEIWEDTVEAMEGPGDCHHWFSQILEKNCKLVYMPAEGTRLLSNNYNSGNEQVSFADGFPMLLIGETSLAILNSKLLEPIRMDRFRPNLVFSGGIAFEEDSWKNFSIGSNQFEACKPCARCVVTTINQQTGMLGKEPLVTLSTFRKHENKIYFGENVKALNFGGILQTGMEIILSSRKPSLFK